MAIVFINSGHHEWGGAFFDRHTRLVGILNLGRSGRSRDSRLATTRPFQNSAFLQQICPLPIPWQSSKDLKTDWMAGNPHIQSSTRHIADVFWQLQACTGGHQPVLGGIHVQRELRQLPPQLGDVRQVRLERKARQSSSETPKLQIIFTPSANEIKTRMNIVERGTLL